MASRGKKLQSTYKNVSAALESGMYPTDKLLDKPSSGHKTAIFPVPTPNARSSHDDISRAKMQLLKDGPGAGVSKFGAIQASDADFQMLLRAKKAEEQANYTKWKMDNFMKNDVVARAWFQEADPGLFESMEKTMVERAKVALRINLLLLRGPKNDEDLILMFALESGKIQLDRDWNVIGPSSQFGSAGGQGVNFATEQERFKEGLFSMSAFRSYNREAANAQGKVRGGGKVWNPFAPTKQQFENDRRFNISQQTSGDSNEDAISKMLASLNFN